MRLHLPLHHIHHPLHCDAVADQQRSDQSIGRFTRSQQRLHAQHADRRLPSRQHHSYGCKYTNVWFVSIDVIRTCTTVCFAFAFSFSFPFPTRSAAAQLSHSDARRPLPTPTVQPPSINSNLQIQKGDRRRKEQAGQHDNDDGGAERDETDPTAPSPFPFAPGSLRPPRLSDRHFGRRPPC